MSDSSDEEGVEQLYESVDSFDDFDDDGEEEVLASSDDDEDYGDDDDDGEEVVEGLQPKSDKFSRFKIERKKDNMASDIEEDDDEDDDVGGPSSQAWGANKQIFYDTDFVDKDYRSQKAKEEDLAKYEEEEALAIQKRLLQSINEKDLGLDFLLDKPPTKLETKTSTSADNVEEDRLRREKVDLNLSALSREHKLAIVRKETPELEPLLVDMRRYLNELKDDLEPALQRLQNCPQAKSTSGLRYIQLRFALLLNYCTNISFYLSLVSSPAERIKDQKIQEHPVIRELFRHKKLIVELDAVRKEKGGKSFEEELEILALSIAQKNEKLVFVSENSQAEDEEIETVVSKTAKKSSALLDDLDDEDDFEEGDEDELEKEEEDGKRAITYAMEKNKGLIPKRKREQRNPRVKYRKKFDRATQRRKGQVREPRKEVKKYGGELTGINARTVKSVKFR